MEIESVNLRAEVERAKRIQKSAEEELGSLSRRKEENEDEARYLEMQRRTIQAERHRDDLLISVKVLHTYRMLLKTKPFFYTGREINYMYNLVHQLNHCQMEFVFVRFTLHTCRQLIVLCNISFNYSLIILALLTTRET